MTPALQLTDIRKRFGGQTVLRGVDLSVQPGAITAVLGPSGGHLEQRPLSHGNALEQGRI